ncbi:MAG: hypothetical protein HY951_05145 [Bacteroidia bacterium]|nr:hypothetical protein [Bacteroidia bacterium]
MKAIKLVLLGTVLFLVSTVQAQVSVNVNIGSLPPWGPVGYPEVRYYYLPDVEAYYDVQSSIFIYYSQGVWIRRTYLPARYRGYDLYGGYKVVMPNYHGNSPYVHFNDHRIKYAKGYHGKAQKTNSFKPESRNSNSNKVQNGNSNNQNYKNDNKSQGHRSSPEKNSNGNSGGKGKKR